MESIQPPFPGGELVNMVVISCVFRKSMMRVTIDFDFRPGTDHKEIGDGVQYNDLRFVFLDQVVHGDQVHLQSIERRPAGMEAQQSLFDVRRQVDADGATCYGRTGPVIPQRQSTGSAPRDGRRHPRRMLPGWSSLIRPSRRPGCCCRGKSPCSPACHPAPRCRWRPFPLKHCARAPAR